MRLQSTVRLLCVIGLATLTFAPARAQKQPVTPADYGRWESLGQARLSPDGRWLAYRVGRVNESVELRVHGEDRDTTIILENATTPEFSADSRWLAFSVGVSPAERERLEQEKKPIHNRLGLLELRTLERTEVERVASFAWSANGRYIALRGYPPEGRSTDAVDVLVRDLGTAATVSFGNITTVAWSERSQLLAMTLTTESGTGNGVQLYDATTGAVRVLDSSTSVYRGLAWREASDDLSVLRTRTDSAWADTTHVILAWRRAGSAESRSLTFDPALAAGFPADMRIAEHATPVWHEDGATIRFGTRPRDRVEKESTEADADSAKEVGEAVKPSDVQVWHANDFRIFPMQRVQESRDLRRTLLAVWHLDDGVFVQAGTDLMESTAVTADGRLATETSVEPYRFDAMFGRGANDIYVTDLRTGDRRRALEAIRYFHGSSSTGRYLIYFRGEDFWTWDTRTGASTNITESIEASFADKDYDYPVDDYPSHGVAGWTTGDRAVWLYDKYDIWSVAPDGSAARRITDGARDSVIHRYLRLDPDEEAIDPAGPVYLSLRGDWSKKSGWGRLRQGRPVERLVFEDRQIGRLMRADSAAVFAYTVEAFDDSPDWFMGGADLRGARQASATNPFQADFAWGRSELIEYTSHAGRRLQGALLYPAGWEPGRRYPMIVYQYEILSTGVHRYVVPSERSYYNHAVFTSNGYFVLLPDIVYRGRDPGRSAVDAIEPAVEAVIEKGLIDPDRVGLVGHSWGGYQATYVPTQTNIFAASVAGAPITNFLSFMGAIHWSAGMPETSHWETGQARMDVPYWEDFDAHVRNSPAAFIDKLDTPMLMMFGDADGTVDWHQGVEFYNFARRAGKTDFVMLVYPGEDHGLRKKENQIDYQRRILQWFGHWLKGEPAPEWITDGVTFMERKKVLGG